MKIVSVSVDEEGSYGPSTMRDVLRRNDALGEGLVVSGVANIDDFSHHLPSQYRIKRNFKTGFATYHGPRTTLLMSLLECLTSDRHSYDFVAFHRWDIVAAFSDIDKEKLEIVARSYGSGSLKVTMRPSVVIMPLTTQ